MSGKCVGMQDWLIKLERAKDLLDAGALTPEEFDAEKARLLPRASMAPVEHDEEHGEDPGEADVTPAFNWTKFAGAAVLLIATALIVYVLLPDQSPSPSPVVPQEMSSQSIPTAPKDTPAEAGPPAPVLAPAEAVFGCIGAYSNVSFSDESGDGSGLFVRMAESGQITWVYYEGSISRGSVAVQTRSEDSIVATVTYMDDPNGPSTSVVLRCKNGRLSASSANFGEITLRKLTATEAAELE